MARRIKIYQIIRKIHLYAAMIVMVFLSMYFITGFLLARYDWFDHDPMNKKIRIARVDLSRYRFDDNFPGKVAEMLSVRGKIDQQKLNEDGSKTIRFIKPGETTVITVSADLRSAKIETMPQNIHEIISFYHRIHGYGGGLKYDLYLFMMDLTSFSLIVFVITGVYLWLKILRNKSWGWLFLALGFLYTGWMIHTFLVN